MITLAISVIDIVFSFNSPHLMQILNLNYLAHYKSNCSVNLNHVLVGLLASLTTPSIDQRSYTRKILEENGMKMQMPCTNPCRSELTNCTEGSTKSNFAAFSAHHMRKQMFGKSLTMWA